MFLAIYVVGAQGPVALMIVLSATFIGFNYGTNLAIFPAYTKAWWGLTSFGTNYGCLMTAWGIGGFVMTLVSSMLVANTGGYVSSFMLAGVLLLIGSGIALTLKGPHCRRRVNSVRRLRIGATSNIQGPSICCCASRLRKWNCCWSRSRSSSRSRRFSSSLVEASRRFCRRLVSRSLRSIWARVP
jgi:hypothetical protein